MAAPCLLMPRLAFFPTRRIDRVPQNNAQVRDGAHSRRRRDGFTFQSETPLPLTFQWRLVSRLVSSSPSSLVAPRLVSRVRLRRSSVSVYRVFAFRSAMVAGFQVRDPLDATATPPPIAVSQTNSASLLFEFETPAARTKLATADCNYSALSVNETSARRCRHHRPTRYDGSLAMRTR